MARSTAPAVLALLALTPGPPWKGQAGSSQFRSLTPTTHRMEVRLEQAAGAGWETVDPGRVLDAGGRVRFRVRANFEGFLYVLNRGTSGAFALLYPRPRDDNRILPGREYPVPASAGHFQITGKPGYETLYWIVSPAPLAPEPDLRAAPLTAEPSAPRPGGPAAPAPPAELLPRCHDEIFRARGECVDAAAGPRAAQFSPRGWQVSAARSRSLDFARHEDFAVISSTAPLTEPVIYEYRLAHR
jgi:hypothetical protein